MKIKRFVGGTLESNCYIIRTTNGGSCFIIDPGYEPQRIADFVKKEGLKPAGILLTHHHHDHVGAAARVSNMLECPVMIHETDAYYYKGRIIMKKLVLPNGLKVSNVALGAMDFGTTTSKENAFAVLVCLSSWKCLTLHSVLVSASCSDKKSVGLTILKYLA